MFIYGAGLAGLLAAHALRRFDPTICESQGSLPNNHGALLRFRTDKVGTACNIPFKKVRVHKAIKYDGKLVTTPNLFLSNLYSQKVTGAILSRSISNLDPVDRYIAPWELISAMSKNCNILYNDPMTMQSIEDAKTHNTPIISTIPMPILMKIVGWSDVPEFPKQKIYTQTARIVDMDCAVHQTVYYPDPITDHYRVSVVGDTVISEFIRKPNMSAGQHTMITLMDDFGIKPNKLVDIKESSQEFGKIRPIDERLRKQFIFEMTTKHNIYSVGRFATWRQLLMDDVVEDLKIIDEFVSKESDYSRWMHSQKGK
jgi:hypothetical protein